MLSIVLINFFNCPESAHPLFDYQLIHRSFVGTDERADDDGCAGARTLRLFALGWTSSPSLGALECSRLPPATVVRGPRLRGERGAPLQRDDDDPAAPVQWVGADRDPGDRPPLAGHLGDHSDEGDDHFLLSAPDGGSCVRVWVVPRARPGRPALARQDGQRGHSCDPGPRRSTPDDRVVLGCTLPSPDLLELGHCSAG